MTWEALGAIGEVVSAIGVIGTLIYLAMQIKSNTTENRLAVNGEIAHAIVLIIMAVFTGVEEPA